MLGRSRGLVRNRLDIVLIAEFTLIDFTTYLPRQFGSIGVDATTYWNATQRWLAGEDPYVNLGGLAFAAPPPTLAALAPFALLPLPAFVLLQLVASLLAATYLLRRLRLPFWYALFPPILEALLVGNPNVLVVALLVIGSPLADGLGTLLKVYALVPAALLGRAKSVVVIVFLLVATAPFLPWVSYASHAAELATVLNIQASGGRSATAFPIMIPIVIVALFVIGRNRAAWLVVPTLWPATQLHYSVLALPATNRLLTAILALPIPGAPVAGVLLDAVVVFVHRRQGMSGSAALTAGT